MKTIIIHYSRFGHTRKLAETIAETLGARTEVEIHDIDEVDVTALADADLVVLGSPTHKMNVPAAVRNALDHLPHGVLYGARVAAYDTSYRHPWPLTHFTAAKKLDRRLHRLGGKRAAPPQTFFVAGREGPLEEGEVERARAWAAAMLQRN